MTHPKLQALIARVQNEQPPLNHPEAFLAHFPDASAIPEGAEKRQSYSFILDALNLAQQGQNPEEARSLVRRALENLRKLRDAQGELEALHFSGRVEHKLGNLDQAMRWYDQALDAARSLHNERAVARAMHERARIYHERDYDFLKAEEGFRYALQYYVDQRDVANLQAALNQLAALAKGAMLFAVLYAPVLERDGVPYGTAEEYLFVRSLAIMGEIADDGHCYRECLIQCATGKAEQDPVLTEYILQEAEETAALHSDQAILKAADDLRRRLYKM